MISFLPMLKSHMTNHQFNSFSLLKFGLYSSLVNISSSNQSEVAYLKYIKYFVINTLFCFILGGIPTANYRGNMFSFYHFCGIES